MKCECDMEAIVPVYDYFLYDEETERPFVNHDPNECKCTNNIKLYKRQDNTTKWLCSCCFLSTDIEVKQ